MEIITLEAYEKAKKRLEELLKITTNETPLNNPLGIEFLEVSNIILRVDIN